MVLVASRLSLALLEAKLREHRIRLRSCEAKDGERVSLFPFEVEFLAVTHSIPDAMAVGIRVGNHLVPHTDDLTMDQLSMDGRLTDLRGLARLGAEGVDLALVDSTSAEVPGFVTSERDIRPVLDRVFAGAERRIVVACVAPHVHGGAPGAGPCPSPRSACGVHGRLDGPQHGCRP